MSKARIKIFSKEDLITFYRGHEWEIIVMSFVSITAVGWYGFSIIDRKGEAFTVLDNLYLSLQLFVLQSGDIRNINPFLEITRFLAPAWVAGATIKTMSVIFNDKFSLLKLRSYKNHIIVCGCNKNSYPLLDDLIRLGRKVVIVDKNIDRVLSKRLKEQGAIILDDDPKSEAVLSKANIARCSDIVIMTPVDATNTEIAIAARKALMSSGESLKFVNCMVHINDRRYGDLINKVYESQNEMLATAQPLKAYVRTFNLYESSARLLFEKKQLYENVDIVGVGEVHLLIVGYGNMGENVLLQAAKIGHFPNGRKIRITVIDKADKKQQFEERYPYINRACSITFERINVNESAFSAFLREKQGTVTYAVVCFDSDELAQEAARKLIIDVKKIPIGIRMTENLLIAQWLEDAKEEYEPIFWFSEPQKSASAELVLDETIEHMAKINNMIYTYVCGRMREIEDNQMSMAMLFEEISGRDIEADWRTLPYFSRGSNRAQAEHIKTKLHAIGLLALPKEKITKGVQILSTVDAEKILAREENLDILARMEHERWNAFHFIDGWQPMQPTKTNHKDPEHKRHACLATWDELDEVSRIRDIDFKAYDRWHVRSIPYVLNRAGYVVCRH